VEILHQRYFAGNQEMLAPLDKERAKYKNRADNLRHVETILKAQGCNVSTGSFGIPYRVHRSDDFLPVVANGGFLPILPNNK
jgi:hypothetical protein